MSIKAVRFLSALLPLSLLLSGLGASPAARAANLEREVANGRLDWTSGTLTVTGSGAPPAIDNPAQKRLMAERAAMVDAYRKLAEAVNGVQVFSETVVKNYVTESDTIRLSVNATIRGARPVSKPRYLSDGTVEIDLAMPIFGRGSLAQALEFGQTLEKEIARPYSSLQRYLAFYGRPLPAPPPPPRQHDESLRLAQGTPAYTGLIVDASGLAAEPAMGPFIVGAGIRVYVSNELDVDPAKIVQEGPLHYVGDLATAKADTQRIGSNPLIIRARSAAGDPVRSNILLDPPTAEKIIEINKNAKFLDQLNVTLVL